MTQIINEQKEETNHRYYSQGICQVGSKPRYFNLYTGEVDLKTKVRFKGYYEFNPYVYRLGTAKSSEQAMDFLNDAQRKLVKKYNYFISKYDAGLYYKVTDVDIIYGFIYPLSKRVCAHNVCFICREELCVLLGCGDKNLTRKLRQYEKKSLIKFTTTGLTQKGYVRILINPAICWVGGSGDALIEWVNHWCSFDKNNLLVTDYGLLGNSFDYPVLDYDTSFDVVTEAVDKEGGSVDVGVYNNPDISSYSTTTLRDWINGYK